MPSALESQLQRGSAPVFGLIVPRNFTRADVTHAASIISTHIGFDVTDFGQRDARAGSGEASVTIVATSEDATLMLDTLDETTIGAIYLALQARHLSTRVSLLAHRIDARGNVLQQTLLAGSEFSHALVAQCVAERNLAP